jgi:hypothetical protein
MQGVKIGMTKSGCFDLHHHFIRAGFTHANVSRKKISVAIGNSGFAIQCHEL